MCYPVCLTKGPRLKSSQTEESPKTLYQVSVHGVKGLWLGGGNGTQIFWGKYVPLRFSKVGSTEHISSLKTRVMGGEIWPKSEEITFKNAHFFSINEKERT